MCVCVCVFPPILTPHRASFPQVDGGECQVEAQQVRGVRGVAHEVQLVESVIHTRTLTQVLSHILPHTPRGKDNNVNTLCTSLTHHLYL